MPLIADKTNLQEAFLRAARGKTGKYAVMEFRKNLDANLNALRHQLIEGDFHFGNYNFFTIHDPKKRVICAASFPERVVFHAMMRICHPVFDNYQIFDSYASRVGKGQYKALDRAKYYCQKYIWFAKMDVCKYFDTIDHNVMLHLLSKLFKDPQLLLYFRDLLDSYEAEQGKGVPIGNLTSQYFANHYLATADHFAKEQQGVPAIVRYMDDVLFFAETKESLCEYVGKYTGYLNESLKLALHLPIINKVCYGVPFLGYVVYGERLRLNKRSRRRFVMKMQRMNEVYHLGRIDESKLARQTSCLFAFIDKADSHNFKHKQYNLGQYS